MKNALNIKDIDTIPTLLFRLAEHFSNTTAVKIKSQEGIIEKTYLQLKNDSMSICYGLINRDIVEEKIAVIGEINYEWIVAYFGIISAGNVVVPIDKDLESKEIKKLLNQADVSVVFYDNRFKDIVEYVKESCKNVKLFVSFQQTEDEISIYDLINDTSNVVSHKININPDQTAMIVFAVNQNGENKGAMLSNKNICHNLIGTVLLLGEDFLKKGESTILILPPHHMFAITQLLLAMYYGVTACIGGGLGDFFKNIKLFKPAVLFLVPMIVESIYKKICKEANKAAKDLKCDIKDLIYQKSLDVLGGNLRVIFSGGAVLPPYLVDKYQEIGITLLNGYGITECSPVVACNRPQLIKKDSVGCIAPKPYCEVKIKDNEILVRGSIVMQGYYKDEISTGQAFDGEWFKTGDLGYIDDDNYLYITGLKKNLIILKDGNNISPVEIEKRLEQHPLIEIAMVYVGNKNEKAILAAMIYPNYEYAAENGIDDIESMVEKAVDEINQVIPIYKRVRKIEIQKNKFNKTQLRELYK